MGLILKTLQVPRALRASTVLLLRKTIKIRFSPNAIFLSADRSSPQRGRWGPVIMAFGDGRDMESIQILNSYISFSSPKSAWTLAVQSQSMRLMMGGDDNLDKIGLESEERGQNLRGESSGNDGVLERLTCTTSEERKH